jgi:RasGEF domain/RasGEF N-terminal motif
MSEMDMHDGGYGVVNVHAAEGDSDIAGVGGTTLLSENGQNLSTWSASRVQHWAASAWNVDYSEYKKLVQNSMAGKDVVDLSLQECIDDLKLTEAAAKSLLAAVASLSSSSSSSSSSGETVSSAKKVVADDDDEKNVDELARVKAQVVIDEDWESERVEVWLVAKGFSPQLAALFSENELCGQDLGELEDEDLRVELGLDDAKIRKRLVDVFQDRDIAAPVAVAASSSSSSPREASSSSAAMETSSSSSPSITLTSSASSPTVVGGVSPRSGDTLDSPKKKKSKTPRAAASSASKRAARAANRSRSTKADLGSSAKDGRALAATISEGTAGGGRRARPASMLHTPKGSKGKSKSMASLAHDGNGAARRGTSSVLAATTNGGSSSPRASAGDVHGWLQPIAGDAEERAEFSRERDDVENMWVSTASASGVVLREKKSFEGVASRFEVKLATLNKLIELLTSAKTSAEKAAHEDFTSVFLTTYLSFADVETLLAKMRERFFVPPGLIDAAAQRGERERAEAEADSVRQAVCQLLRHWFTNFYRDFNGGTIKLLQSLASDAMAEVADRPSADKLRITIRFFEKTVDAKLQKGTYSSMFSADKLVVEPPPPLLPKPPINWRQTDILDIDSLEIARQITIADYHLYADVKPVEFFGLAWSKTELQHRAPNVLQLINRFNMFSGLAASLVVRERALKQRRRTLQKVLDIMQHLYELQNFNGCMAFLSAINNSAIYRLKLTFADLPKKNSAFLAEMQELLSSTKAYGAYRTAYNNAKPPCIPFIGVYLSDLTFMEDGNPDDVNGLINFYKRTLIRTVVDDVLRHQVVCYNLKLIPQLQSLIARIPRLSEEKMYEHSMDYEPRGMSKKEVVAKEKKDFKSQ